jgi:cyclohexa-1,5-dienecarbonyl-CoA hydratase
MTEFNFLRWETTDGIGTLTINRPPLNVINIAMLRELGIALTLAANDSALRLLTLRAAGKLFSAGVDVADHTADKVGEMIPLFNQVCLALANFPAPTLAVVHHHALGGGCELALCCDLIIAAETANFGQPEIKLATVAPVASLYLPGVIGYRQAAELLFTGETISAIEAARTGLINRAAPAAELNQIVDGYMTRFRALSAPALRLAKKSLRFGTEGWANQAILASEKLYLDELMATADAHEGVQSFIEKRAPIWKHQ